MNSCVFCITGKEFDIAPERFHDRSSVWGPCSVNTLTTAPASPSVRPAGSWWSCSRFLDEKKQQSVRIVDFFFRGVTKILMWNAVVSWEHDARPCASSSTHANYISLKCFLWFELKSAILNLDEVALQFNLSSNATCYKHEGFKCRCTGRSVSHTAGLEPNSCSACFGF